VQAGKQAGSQAGSQAGGQAVVKQAGAVHKALCVGQSSACLAGLEGVCTGQDCVLH
jgi:hypothetical protein